MKRTNLLHLKPGDRLHCAGPDSPDTYEVADVTHASPENVRLEFTSGTARHCELTPFSDVALTRKPTAELPGLLTFFG